MWVVHSNEMCVVTVALVHMTKDHPLRIHLFVNKPFQNPSSSPQHDVAQHQSSGENAAEKGRRRLCGGIATVIGCNGGGSGIGRVEFRRGHLDAAAVQQFGAVQFVRPVRLDEGVPILWPADASRVLRRRNCSFSSMLPVCFVFHWVFVLIDIVHVGTNMSSI